MVPASMNKLPVVGQNAHKAAGPDPRDTPTPLRTPQNKRTPLQVYETSKPFFGSAPVGGLDILCSESPSCKPMICQYFGFDGIDDDDDDDAKNDINVAFMLAIQLAKTNVAKSTTGPHAMTLMITSIIYYSSAWHVQHA